MKLERLSDKNHIYYKQAFELYKSAFPEIERRDDEEQKRIMQNSYYHFDLIFDNDDFIGIMLYWELDNLIFLEHFTTLPELRNHGYGAKSLDLLKQKGKTVILEIENPIDELTKRRFEFYRRNGFVMTEIYHIQAKYHLGYDDLMLKILSYPDKISESEYIGFLNFMTQEIGILPKFANNVTVRPMQASDDAEVVAKLIYLSDVFIYPTWFDSIEDGVKVISRMIDLHTLYNRKNILLAVNSEDKIVGALVGTEDPIDETEDAIRQAFALAGVKSDERTHYIFKNYYGKMTNEKGEFYVANITVDPDFRHQGIGATLLHEAVKDKKYSHLECVKENIGAWRVYQRLGFSIIEEYPGVYDVPCYNMVRKEE